MAARQSRSISLCYADDTIIARAVQNALKHRSISDRVAEYLRQSIFDGGIKPGERIIELEISATLGVSRSPIREALLLLSQEGLVTILPYRGAIVSRLTKEVFKQLLNFRLMLEDFAITTVANSAGDDAVEILRKQITSIRRSSEEGNFIECVEADLHAHKCLIGLAGNIFLEQAYTETTSLMRMYIRMTSMYYQNTKELADEHESIIDALLAHDTERARMLMRKHIEHGFQEACSTLET